MYSYPACQLLASKRLAKIVTIISWKIPVRGFVLDVGCGDGTLLVNISAEEKVGIDLDTAYVKKMKNADVIFVRADATHLPFKPCTFDLTITSELLEHLGNPLACVEEIKRATKKGGYFLVSIPNDACFITAKFFLLRWRSIQKTLQEHKHHFGLSKPLVSSLGKPVVNYQFPFPLFWFNKIMLWLVSK